MDALWGEAKAPKRTFGSAKTPAFALIPLLPDLPPAAGPVKPEFLRSDDLAEPAAGGAPGAAPPVEVSFSDLLRERTASLLAGGGAPARPRRPRLKSRLARALRAGAAAPRGGTPAAAGGGVAAHSDDEDGEIGRLFGVCEDAGGVAMRAAFRRVTMAPGALAERCATAVALRRATMTPPRAPSPEQPATVAAPRASLAPASVRFAPDPAPSRGAALAERALAAALPAVLQFLPARLLLSVAPAVSHAWAAACAHEVAWRVACGVGGGGVRERISGGDGWGGAAAGAPPPPPAAPKGRGAAGKSKAAAASATAAAAAAAAAPAPPLLTSWAPFLEAFPCGTFIASGAYKQVYRVWCAPRARWEAVSVLDAAAAAGGSRSARSMLQAEVQAGCLLAQLLRSGACPHFVATHGAFLHVASPEAHFPRLWALPRGAPPPFSAALPSPAAARGVGAASALAFFEGAAPRAPPPPATRGQFLYTRMELCVCDVEGFLRGEEARAGAAESASGAALAASDDAAAALAAALTWQMVFALYVGRERLCLRHYDLKLLNWLLLPAADMLPPAAPPPLRLRYVVGGDAPLTLEPSLVVKLTDFGSASVREDTLGAPLKLAHWTTIENAPPEFFTLGDAVCPGYATDTWALGLCVLHLLLGACPYEEALAGCVAPAPLRSVLQAAWSDPAAPYAAIRKLIEIDEEDGAGGGTAAPCLGDTLADTLWRFAVLLGGVPAAGAGAATAPHSLLRAACSGDAAPAAAPAAGNRRAPRGGKAPPAALGPTDLAACRAAFARDAARYSLAAGDAPLLVRARRRAALLPPAFRRLLEAMLAWEAAARPTMLTAMRSGAFDALRGEGAAPPHYSYSCDAEGSVADV